MIDLGTVRPCSTIRIPFATFKGSDGSSITMSSYVAGDVQIYKDGGTTQRASSAGITATTDFDSSTGLHLAVIDLADNTTSGFYNAGSEYLVAIADVTIDSVTVRTWVARFTIGYSDAIINTTIASLSSQTSFTLTAGPAEASALIGCTVLVHDLASSVQRAIGYCSAYAVTSKTVTLKADPGIFTMATGDNVSFFMPSNAQAIYSSVAAASKAADGWSGLVADSGTAQAGGSSTITLQSGAVATNSYYNGAVVTILSGTGAGQSRQIASYVGSTKVATVDSAWVVNPDSTSKYQIIGRIV